METPPTTIMNMAKAEKTKAMKGMAEAGMSISVDLQTFASSMPRGIDRHQSPQKYAR